MMVMCKQLKNRQSTGPNEPQPDVICGKTCYDLPVKTIEPLSSRLISAYTGPGAGLISVNTDCRSKAFQAPPELADDVAFIDEEDEDIDDNYSSNNTSNNNSPEPALTVNKYSLRQLNNGDSTKVEKSEVKTSQQSSETTTTITTTQKSLTATSTTISPSSSPSSTKSSSFSPSSSSLESPSLEEIAGVRNWYCPTDNAFGLATTLYESHPTTKERAGEPIADSFAICVRENSAILALADGVNWGEGACIAARSAIHGSIEYLNKALYKEGGGKVANTMDIFVSLLRSFSAAHNMILQENGKLTTLTVAVITQLRNSDKCIVCSCNVGDSFAYVYSKKHGVREITQGSHDIFSMRDMRSALGALGPVDGTNPELNNLTVAMTIVEQGDIVFLCSDGISDNFDPVVGKFALAKKQEKPNNNTDNTVIRNDNNKATNGLITNKTNSEKVSTKNKINSKIFCSRSNSVKSTSNNHSRRKSEGLISRLTEDFKSSSDKSSRHQHSNNYHHSTNNNSSSNNKSKSSNNNHSQHPTNNNSKTNNKEVKLKRCNSIPDRYHSALPFVTAVQRHELTLLRMEDIIRNGFGTTANDKDCGTTAKQLCELMIEFATKLTTAKRRILEDPDLYDNSDLSFEHYDQRQRRRQVGDKLVMVPGKLDHATIVACKVSFYGDYLNKRYYSDDDHNKYNLKLKATLAKIEGTED